MADRNAKGIDYFSFHCGFFDDDKIALIEEEFGGCQASYIAIRLLCKIYSSEGYYYRWGDTERLLFTRKLGASIRRSDKNGSLANYVDEVVRGLVRRRFFDKRCFDQFGILTSAGIQRRYFEASKRRQDVTARREYLLIDPSKFPNVRIWGENVDIKPENVYIPPQSKGKEKKVKETPPHTPPRGVESSSQEGGEDFLGNSSERVGECPPSGSAYRTRNGDTFRLALASLGGCKDWHDELLRLSNGGDPQSPVWGLLDDMRRAGGKVTMSDVVRTAQAYERQGLIRCKSPRRMQIERELPAMLRPEEVTAVLMALTCAAREERCLLCMADIRRSEGRIKMPAKYILAELRKVE